MSNSPSRTKYKLFKRAVHITIYQALSCRNVTTFILISEVLSIVRRVENISYRWWRKICSKAGSLFFSRKAKTQSCRFSFHRFSRLLCFIRLLSLSFTSSLYLLLLFCALMVTIFLQVYFSLVLLFIRH